MKEILNFQNVYKGFAGVSVLKNISFSLYPGKSLVLLGPNGAGKSTLISLMVGLNEPDSGQIVFQKLKKGQNKKFFFSYLPQENIMPPNISGRDFLEFLKGHKNEDHAPISLSVEALELERFWHLPIRSLSGGQRRLLNLAGVISRGTELLILDEPTTGLDAEVRSKIWDLLDEYKKQGGSLFVSTHFFREAELLANRILILNKGEVIQEGELRDIRFEFTKKRLSFRSRSGLNYQEFDNFFYQDNNRQWVLESSEPEILLKNIFHHQGFESDLFDIEIREMDLEETLKIILSKKRVKDA